VTFDISDLARLLPVWSASVRASWFNPLVHYSSCVRCATGIGARTSVVHPVQCQPSFNYLESLFVAKSVCWRHWSQVYGSCRPAAVPYFFQWSLNVLQTSAAPWGLRD